MLLATLLALTYPTIPDTPGYDPEHRAYIVPPGQGFDGVVLLDIRADEDRQRYCTGSLLESGQHILTAAHCVDVAPEDITVHFHLPNSTPTFVGETTTRNVAFVNPHPAWQPESPDHDIAVLTLATAAPIAAERYAIYRQFDERDRLFLRLGYGLTGSGFTGEKKPTTPTRPQKRLGRNRYDAHAEDLLQRSIAPDATPEFPEASGNPSPLPRSADDAMGREVTLAPFSFPDFFKNLPNLPERPADLEALLRVEDLGAIADSQPGQPDKNTPPLAQPSPNVLEESPDRFQPPIQRPRPRSVPRPQNLVNFTAARTLVYDLDSGFQRHDVLGQRFGLFDVGLGVGGGVPAIPESGMGLGDSGGPSFLQGKIVGIASHRISIPGLDLTKQEDGSIGELFVDIRVSAYADFIDRVLATQTPWTDQR